MTEMTTGRCWLVVSQPEAIMAGHGHPVKRDQFASCKDAAAALAFGKLYEFPQEIFTCCGLRTHTYAADVYVTFHGLTQSGQVKAKWCS